MATEKYIEDLLTTAYALRTQDLQKAITLTQQALTYANEKSTALGVAQAKNQIGLFYFITGKFDLAHTYSEEALAYFESIHNKQGIAHARYNIGSILYRTDNFHKGLQYLLESLALYQELNDLHNQCRVLKSMGTIYEYFNDIDNATKAYLQCIELSKKTGDLNSESNAYNPLSGILLDQGNVEQSMEIIEKSILLKEQTKDRRGLAFAWYGRGKVWLKKNETAKAIEDFTNSLAIQQEANDLLGIGMVHNKLGAAYLQINNYSAARASFHHALSISIANNLKFIQFKAYHNLYVVATKEGNTSEALTLLEHYIRCKEQVINAETHNIIKSYEAINKIQALEQETKAQREKTSIIEEKNKELDSFFYRVSHDLKGPISSLIGLHQVVTMDITDKTALMYFTMYHHQIQRINNIVLSLIDITRMKHLEVKREPIEFEQLVDECIKSYSYFENYRSIEFIKEIQHPIHFTSEWAIVNTILQNLIENAIKYARNDVKPFVRIAIYEFEQQIVLMVEDNGQGIPEQHQSKIFDMFHRANDRIQGTGLGLYILKRAVERLQGTIRLTSELGLGSKFIVTLPRISNEQP